MGFVWIIIGVIYILYKLQKEEKIFTAKGVAIGCAVIAWVFVPWLICLALFCEDIADIVSVVTFGLPLFCAIIYAIYLHVSTYLEGGKERKRIKELSKMSDYELGKLLGVSLEDIPFIGVYNSSRFYAIESILESEGLSSYPMTNERAKFEELIKNHKK